MPFLGTLKNKYQVSIILTIFYQQSDVTFLIRAPIQFEIFQIATNMATLKIEI